MRINKITKYSFVVLSILAIWVVEAYFRDGDISDPNHILGKEKYLAEVERDHHLSKAPNIVVILFDDMGYGDIGVFGNRAYQTPELDELAKNGLMLTQYYAPSAVCSPSRAATLTGRYAPRTGVPDVLVRNHTPVAVALNMFGKNTEGLARDEITLPETLRAAGYRTAMIGKWHLGDTPGHLPNDFGFDSFYGMLYSNDMPPLVLLRDRVKEVVDVDPTTLTERYTEAAIKFIKERDHRPFFLYLAHNMPHEPLAPGAAFKGRSGSGLYGDAVVELDSSTLRLIEALRDTGALQNTLIIISSDNGPWFEGSPGGRGRKGTTFEGGMRVPFIAYWEGHIVPQVSSVPAMGIDIFPTILDLLNVTLPDDRQIDGVSLRSLFDGPGNLTERSIDYFSGGKLMALRHGNLKYQNAKPVQYVVDEMKFAIPFTKGPWLFDLDKDPDESYNLFNASANRDQALDQDMKTAAQDFRKNPRGWR